MKRTILFALLAVAATVLCTDSAHARWRNRCNNSNSWNTWNSYTTSTMTAPTVATNAQPGMAVAQGNSGSSYQSFSYEPGAAPAVAATVAPAPMYQVRRSNRSEYDSVLRGDRKVHGHTATAE